MKVVGFRKFGLLFLIYSFDGLTAQLIVSLVHLHFLRAERSHLNLFVALSRDWIQLSGANLDSCFFVEFLSQKILLRIAF